MGEHGQGSKFKVTRRRKDGTVRTRVVVAVTMADGRRVYRWSPSDREAERKRRTLIEARELDLDPTRQTLGAFLRSWIASQRDARRRRIRDRTIAGYERIIEQRILPGLGDVALAQLSRRKIQAWIDQQPGSPQTVRNDHAVLRKALAAAAGDLIPMNPAIGVELPERARFHGAPMTLEEARALLEATSSTRLAALWRLALMTGLREGELLGLSRDALEGATLTVAGQLQRVAGELVDGKRRRGRWILGPVKVARALEEIELDAETVALVRRHLAAMAEERRPSWRYFGLMFVTEAGEPFHQSTVLAEFHRACDLAGIPRRRVHDLRHTASRLLKDAGVSPEVRKARFGHSTDAMAEHYGGASSIADRAAVELLAERLTG